MHDTSREPVKERLYRDRRPADNHERAFITVTLSEEALAP